MAGAPADTRLKWGTKDRHGDQSGGVLLAANNEIKKGRRGTRKTTAACVSKGLAEGVKRAASGKSCRPRLPGTFTGSPVSEPSVKKAGLDPAFFLWLL